ncbi:MAG: sulfur carrier protein ThiS [Clostridiales bacterium]|nr:sulfur carrier protein ThiS [Clostridiales bacterium]MCD8215321.1 sulfur carrier protein ThiS [Clostridiales bacterium]
MKITVSGEVKEYKDGTTLKELVAAEKVETPEYVTGSVNDELYSARDFEGIVLKDGDVIEFLYFMGGGSYNGIY